MKKGIISSTSCLLVYVLGVFAFVVASAEQVFAKNNVNSLTGSLQANKPESSRVTNTISVIQIQPMVREGKPASKLGYTLDYAVSTQTSLSIDEVVKHTWDQFEDQKPTRLEDLTLSMNNQWSFINLESYLVFPTSEDSAKESMRFGAGLKPTLFTDMGRNRFSVSQGLTYYNYEYETADQAGSKYNTRYAADTTLAYAYKLTKFQRISTNAGLLSTQDYADHFDQAYFLGFGWGMAVSNAISVTASARTQDQVITQKKIFDYDRSLFALGVNYAF